MKPKTTVLASLGLVAFAVLLLLGVIYLNQPANVNFSNINQVNHSANALNALSKSETEEIKTDSDIIAETAKKAFEELEKLEGTTPQI